jgi:hypothetical protein
VRTRLVLAETLVAAARGPGRLPAEARTLREEALAEFAKSGAALNLAQAEQLWQPEVSPCRPRNIDRRGRTNEQLVWPLVADTVRL